MFHASCMVKLKQLEEETRTLSVLTSSSLKEEIEQRVEKVTQQKTIAQEKMTAVNYTCISWTEYMPICNQLSHICM